MGAECPFRTTKRHHRRYYQINLGIASMAAGQPDTSTAMLGFRHGVLTQII